MILIFVGAIIILGGKLCQGCDSTRTCNEMDYSKTWTCHNGGIQQLQCRDGGNTIFSCLCPSGYLPYDCSLRDYCSDNPCQNGGTCSNVNNCTCSKNLYPACYTEINCSDLPCVRDGTISGTYNCRCPPGFYGRDCEQAICDPTKADVIFVLDSSLSMTEAMFQKQKEFINAFIDQITIGQSNFLISIITFSSNAEIQIYLDDYTTNEALKTAVLNVTFTPGATFTNKGLALVDDVINNGRRIHNQYVTRFVIVVTDGMSTDRQATKEKAAILKANMLIHKVVSIGVGHQVSHQELMAIASKSDSFTPSYVFSVQNFNSLFTIVKELVHITCDSYIKSDFSEVVLLLDTGAFSGFQNHNREAIMRFIDDLNIGLPNNGTQATVVTFNDYANKMASIGRSSTKQDILSKIASTFEANATKSDIMYALRYVEQEIFSKLTTTRKFARKFVIIFSNGNFSHISDRDLTSMESRLKNDNITVFAVGTGYNVIMDKLLQIVTDPYNVFVILEQQYHVLDNLNSFFTYNAPKA